MNNGLSTLSLSLLSLSLFLSLSLSLFVWLLLSWLDSVDEEFLAEQRRVQALPKEELTVYSYDVLTVRISSYYY